MKTKTIFLSILSIAIVAFAFKNFAVKDEKEAWTKQQLMEPADMAKIINNPSSKKPIIYSVGPGGDIKGSIEMGAAQEKENLDKLQTELNKMAKDTDIVIFCGCCPFKDCPNIRPAFKLLNEMKFTNHKLLNLSHNLKVDWIDKGYPINE